VPLAQNHCLRRGLVIANRLRDTPCWLVKVGRAVTGDLYGPRGLWGRPGEGSRLPSTSSARQRPSVGFHFEAPSAAGPGGGGEARPRPAMNAGGPPGDEQHTVPGPITSSPAVAISEPQPAQLRGTTSPTPRIEFGCRRGAVPITPR